MKKTVVNDSKNGEQPLAPEKKPATQLEEDDEFEDFPVESKSIEISHLWSWLTASLDWTVEDAQIPNGNTHLWEESWDDDDTNDDFAVQLR